MSGRELLLIKSMNNLKFIDKYNDYLETCCFRISKGQVFYGML